MTTLGARSFVAHRDEDGGWRDTPAAPPRKPCVFVPDKAKSAEAAQQARPYSAPLPSFPTPLPHAPSLLHPSFPTIQALRDVFAGSLLLFGRSRDPCHPRHVTPVT